MAADGTSAGARPEDVGAFLAVLADLAAGRDPTLRDLLRPDAPAVVARAPGRLDVMGGIADYSGSLVLQLPLAEATFAVAQRAAEPNVLVATLPQHGVASPQLFAVACDELARLAAQGYDAGREFFAREPRRHWASYAVGTLLALARERGVAIPGLRIVVASRVPSGKGVSSSAALEVAVLQAATRLLGVALEGRELATLCQLAENLIAGAPCGIMDQMTAALGQEDRLLALLCQPAEVRGHVAIPPEIRFFGIDSGVRHAVAGADYGSVRVGAFMGYRILADHFGLAVTEAERDGVVAVADPELGGYLANVEPSRFAAVAAAIPERLDGRAFLQRYGGITDTVTRVDPDRVYAVRQPTAHPIAEHARVTRFAELLPHAADEHALRAMGELMYASHDSYSACGLGSAATDHLVALVRAAGPARGLYGAKITGGGSGGTVAVLARADAGPAVAAIAARHALETGCEERVFTGSSPGACAFGALEAARLDAIR